MLDQWQENLAILAANRAAGDDKVITHLGDCLWRTRGEVAAAHMCYLVADAQPEAFSGTSRVCLIGVDQYKYPRTFATPEGIQVAVTAFLLGFRCRARGVFWPLFERLLSGHLSDCLWWEPGGIRGSPHLPSVDLYE